MYNQGVKSYLKIDKMLANEKPEKVQPSTGLLGMRNKQTETQDKPEEPMQRVAKVVKDMRKARMELRNGSS